MNLLKVTGAALLCSLTMMSWAHVPFLKPNQFRVLHNRLQIESSFTEFPFQADFAMDAPEYILIGPAGKPAVIAPVARLKAANYLEPVLTDSGTYRIHAGLRKGPLYKALETADGKLYFADDIKTKTGTKTTLRYFSSADTYIAMGSPAYKTSNVIGKGMEIIPQTSPNQLYPGTATQFRVYFNGQPVPQARVVVVYDNEHFDKHRIEDLYDVENVRKSNIVADKEGIFSFTPRKAGIVLLFVTLHKKIDNSLWESYNSSLSLQVNLPEN